LLEKRKNCQHTVRRIFEGRRAYEKKRIFRRRRRRGLPILLALMVVFLAGLGATSLFGDARSDTVGSKVARVDVPALAEAPEPVADLQAQAEREAAEREAAQRKAAEERAAQRAAEKKAAEQEIAAPPPPSDPTLYLTVPKLGVYGHTVRNDDSQWALDQGAIKLPSTAFPWQDNGNTYIAGHRIGWPGTESYYQFWELPAMQQGDAIFLEDANGTVYEYRVTEKFAVHPWETWVTEPIAGRDMVTLQTCTETVNDWWTIGPRLMESGPESGRLVVRADRVG
jgi:LPXTG-site transpeptidase (sortase) family protein